VSEGNVTVVEDEEELALPATSKAQVVDDPALAENS
jgi:hypothetical protein